MKKAEAMDRWEKLPENMPIMPHFAAIPYKSRGSNYGACGIRIDGTPEFIDAVLSHLKELLQGEGIDTRLGLARNVVDGSGIGKETPNRASNDAECCYIRLHERGIEGKFLAAVDRAATARRQIALEI